MLILAIDTALNACSTALLRSGELLVSRTEPMAKGQAERLAPMTRELLAGVGIRPSQIDRIAVTRGPGAFTGLRIGLAFARGLAVALDRPCVGVSTLEVLAHGASALRTVAVIEVAGSLFVGAWEGRTCLLQPCRLSAEDALMRLEGDWSLTGPGAHVLARLRPDWPVVAQDLPDPVVLAQLGQHLDPHLNLPAPLYLRGHEAKLPGGLSLEVEIV
ncbi:MAG: tRNA (adenosine(37)-N6)-threonylcarbamoyltransferase complex dimerization subunit type 1 TsaB [Hyphomonadaceae bacterium]|jgi:tRNA threonylcarbamoyladenosine biosynthesis protein TsaB|uniref:tRNA (adenosine(37)-N6)-threonylcarbamoyltransferase complex dimerization subunit type 1 TsaB n=1 Tax=Aquidulcibacter sp. TaxID=2052990 RepID=UPI0022CD1307|nr:tRNA (adenosine(37)-N6)-threonylcarbamoyltransferase complex dimerization subunit type 1 TsaB [Aquidulcibacter sp.]MCE2890372.1 tRNA (adenosine(37)-N6)-threonylcarbamoyltransferase complex dimerization subunit type 1 TsaB [Hyphomonadaceae bacterium]MCZ8207570.1 tRNA (adenosine(37)-N6)-threonylcarbamoyltransferase complex dimerization subunit type 1 TsaB [Aquidulcibacter sp.]